MLKYIKMILSGEILLSEWVRNQYRITILICGLFFVYIYFGYQSERQQHKMHQLKLELQDAQFTKQTLNAQTMSLTRQSSIAKMLDERGSKLQESHQSAIRIE